MKLLLTLTLTMMFSQAHAQSYMSSGAPTGSATAAMPEATISGPGTNQPTFGSDVPYKGTTSGNAAGSMRRNSDTMNNTNTTSDTIGTTQSSTTTTTTTTKPRRVIPITPANTNPNTGNCVDRAGRTFNTGDSGYTSCVNSMRTR